MQFVYQTPFCCLYLKFSPTALQVLSFSPIKGEEYACGNFPSLVQDTFLNLDAYFSGTRKTFSVPLDLQGTPFQKMVWQALLQIPYGETKSYGQIAAQIGKPKAARAVGMACNRNHIGIIVPCHRVIGSSGSLTGYAAGLEIKKTLLNLEKQNCLNQFI